MDEKVNKPKLFKVFSRHSIVNDHVIEIDPYWETIITRDEKRDIYRVFTWSDEDEDDSPKEIKSYEEADLRLYQSTLETLVNLGVFPAEEIYEYNRKAEGKRLEARKEKDIAQMSSLIHEYPDVAAEILAK